MFDLNAFFSNLSSFYSPTRVFDWIHLFIQFMNDSLNTLMQLRP